MLYLELAIIFILILVNGLLAMAELAIVSSRRSRLQAVVDRGVVGSRRALALAEDPGKFLSTVQIGITLVGVLSGAFSGATLGLRLGQWLLSLGVPAVVAEPTGVGLVVAVITYFSLIVGELGSVVLYAFRSFIYFSHNCEIDIDLAQIQLHSNPALKT